MFSRFLFIIKTKNMSIEAPTGSEQDPRITSIEAELRAYGEQYKLRGLEGRIQRGLDPAGMLAVKETKEKLIRLSEAMGSKEEDIVALTNKLHVGAIWEYADELAKGEDPTIKSWMVAGEITVAGKEKEGDLSQDEFLKDLERVNSLLDQALENPEEFAKKAHHNLIVKSREQFGVEDAVPISDLDSGFLAMAVNGYHSGIVRDKGGLLFVGAGKLGFGVLEEVGLKISEREDRGRMATFYVDNQGKEVVKKLNDGFAIVLTGDMELAKKLAGSLEKG